MRNIVFSLICVLWFVLANLGFAEDAPLRLGVIAALSGPAAPFGIAAKNGIELARSELGNKRDIKVIYEDDQFDPKKTVSAFRKLHSAGELDVLVTIGSTPSNAIASLAERHNVLLLAAASDKRVSEGRKFVIRTWRSGKEEGQRVGEEALRRGLKSVAVIMTRNDYHESLKRGFVSFFPSERLRMVEEYNPGGEDFKPFLLKAKRNRVDGVAMFLHPGGASLLSKQARAINYTPEFFSAIQLEDSRELEQSQGALKGAWYVTGGCTKEFQERYFERFQNTEIISLAALHYDLFHLLADYRGGVSSESLRNYILKRETFEGAMGQTAIRQTQDDQYFHIPLEVQNL